MPSHKEIEQQRGHKAAHCKYDAVKTDYRSLRPIKHKPCKAAEYCRIERILECRDTYCR